MTESGTQDQYELPSAFETDPDSETVPEVVALEDSDAVDPDTGKTVHPNAMPTNAVDPYNLRYKPNPAIQFENYVPFPNHTGDTLAEDQSLNPLRSAGLTPEITQDKDQPQTPEEALGLYPESEGNDETVDNSETGEDVVVEEEDDNPFENA